MSFKIKTKKELNKLSYSELNDYFNKLNDFLFDYTHVISSLLDKKIM